MISTRLFGGLGNQMFIYAMIKALSLRNNEPISFNCRQGFAEDKEFFRNLEINKLNVKLDEDRLRCFDIPLGHFIRRLSRRIGRNIVLPYNRYIIEDDERVFDHKYLDIKNAYIEGYWQSPLYFKEFEDVIKEDFKITIDIRDEVKHEAQLIMQSGYTPVMIGIRRYQECKSGNSPLLGNLTDNEYYKRAIHYMEAKVDKPLFVVFTQAKDWAKENLPENFEYYYVTEKDSEDSTIEDLYLMEQCKHFIISNSTYYWWGAWLGQSEGSIVIASDNFLNRDCICSNWMKL